MKQLLAAFILLYSFCLTGQMESNNEYPDSKIVRVNQKLSNDFGFSLNPVLGSGAGIGSEDSWLVTGLELDVYKNNLLYSFQYYHLENYVIFGRSAHRTQVGFRLGKQTNGHLLRFRYQLGIAYYDGQYKYPTSRGEKGEVSALGLTTRIGFEYIPFSFLSIGLDVESNFNAEESILMPLLKIGIGKIRPKKRKKSPLFSMQ